MKKSTYKIIVHPVFGESVQRIDLDGSVWSIPKDLSNSDYQAYLEHLTENPTEDVE